MKFLVLREMGQVGHGISISLIFTLVSVSATGAWQDLENPDATKVCIKTDSSSHLYYAQECSEGIFLLYSL